MWEFQFLNNLHNIDACPFIPAFLVNIEKHLIPCDLHISNDNFELLKLTAQLSLYLLVIWISLEEGLSSLSN